MLIENVGQILIEIGIGIVAETWIWICFLSYVAICVVVESFSGMQSDEDFEIVRDFDVYLCFVIVNGMDFFFDGVGFDFDFSNIVFFLHRNLHHHHHGHQNHQDHL